MADSRRETGFRRLEMRDRMQEVATEIRETRDRRRKMGDRREETGDMRHETGEGSLTSYQKNVSLITYNSLKIINFSISCISSTERITDHEKS